jgi:riboflavin biosynthesis pyrimidine reductase
LPHQRNPERIIFDPKGRLLDLDRERLRGFTVLVCESELKSKGLPLREGWISVPTSPDSPDHWSSFREAVQSLDFGRPLQSILIEGGPRLLSQMFKHDFFTVVHRFVGTKTFPSVNESGRLDWVPGSEWKLQTNEEIDGDRLQEWIKED